MQMMFAIAH